MAFSFDQHSNDPYKPMSEINVTPFVDVMLVLLVIFIITAPMMTQGLNVDLPDVVSQPIENADDKVLLTITKHKKIKVGSTEVALKDLKQMLLHNAKIKEDKAIVLQADKNVPYGFVAHVMQLARDGGATNISLAMDASQNDES